MKTVVVGYDGSEEAKRALDRAAALGRAGAKVIVVTGVELSLSGGRSMGAVDSHVVAAGAETLDAARNHLKTQGIDAEAIEGTGDPADVIIEAAKEHNADVIVVGTRGLNAAERLVLGSVSTKIVHHAPCDVLVVR
jgi:nucleotide-binding universal stress UspA family protein